jgi:hypothetical protein
MVMKVNLAVRLSAGVLLAGLLALGAGAGVAAASAGGAASNLLCFTGSTTGYGGRCTVSGHGRSVATLSETTSNATGTYSGVYLHKHNLAGVPLSEISKLGYTWTAMTTTPTPQPGSLSLNIGISATGGGTSTTTYLYIDAYYCPGTSRAPGTGATSGTVTVVNDANCGMYFKGTFYPNWASLLKAYPTATVGTTTEPFIIAERTPGTPPAVWQVSNVYLGTL